MNKQEREANWNKRVEDYIKRLSYDIPFQDAVWSSYLKTRRKVENFVAYGLGLAPYETLEDWLQRRSDMRTAMPSQIKRAYKIIAKGR